MRKKTIISVMFSVAILLGAMFVLKNNTVSFAATKINVNIGGKNFTATLEDNASANAFTKHLPESFNMSELNGNEKYKCRVTVVDKKMNDNSTAKEESADIVRQETDNKTQIVTSARQELLQTARY